jgi:hypothetical protein
MTEPTERDEYNPNNPYTAIALLGERFKALLEKERELERREGELEKRVEKIEASFNRAAPESS